MSSALSHNGVFHQWVPKPWVVQVRTVLYRPLRAVQIPSARGLSVRSCLAALPPVSHLPRETAPPDPASPLLHPDRPNWPLLPSATPSPPRAPEPTDLGSGRGREGSTSLPARTLCTEVLSSDVDSGTLAVSVDILVSQLGGCALRTASVGQAVSSAFSNAQDNTQHRNPDPNPPET